VYGYPWQARLSTAEQKQTIAGEKKIAAPFFFF